tara:strand:+ start:2772 stop:3092 length:321 start_codon:yes stop_codon:yes gene_type:complete
MKAVDHSNKGGVKAPLALFRKDSKMDFSKLFPLYHKALLLSGDPHWGTEEQINAENAFFSEAKALAEKTGLAEEYQEHCDGLLKANAEEMLLFTVNFFLDQGSVDA